MEEFLTKLKGAIAIVGGYLASKLGGWDLLLEVLANFLVVDYILGVVSSIINNEVNSSVGALGILKKILILVSVGVAYSLDQLFGVDMFRNLAVMFYVANEGISIIENMGKMGVPMPNPIREAFEQLKDENDVINEEEGK